MKYLTLFLALNFLGCATARTWVISEYKDGGVIGYENYNPSQDGGAKILKKIKCLDHKMTSNPIMRGYAQPSAYQAYSSGLIIPLDGGQYEWREYHYTCNIKNKTTKSYSSDSSSYCSKSCEDMYSRGELINGLTVESCILQSCG